MRIISLLIPLLLIGAAAANTNTLGPYNVSVNLSVPANYAVETPTYDSSSDMWTYTMNIIPSTGGNAVINVNELNYPIYGSGLVRDFAEYAINSTKEIGNRKYGMTTYQGHDAFFISYPAQVSKSDGSSQTFAEFHGLVFMLDERSRILVSTMNTGEAVYKEILNSLNVTKTVRM